MPGSRSQCGNLEARGGSLSPPSPLPARLGKEPHSYGNFSQEQGGPRGRGGAFLRLCPVGLPSGLEGPVPEEDTAGAAQQADHGG